MAMLRHLARWLAWQIGELEVPVYQPPARITVFSTGDNAPGEIGA
jgi:hypothetical protein